MRWAGDRLDSRGTSEQQRRRRGDRVVATIDSLIDQLAVMRGAAMKAGQVLSTDRVPRSRPRPVRVPPEPPRFASRRCPTGQLEADARGDRRGLGIGPGADPGRDRPRARRGGEHRAGLPRADPRGARGRDQGPVPRDRRDGRIRHAQPAVAQPAAAPADAGAGDQGPARGAARADSRGMRLRAGGEQPPPRRPLLARPSVRLRPRGRHRAQPPAGTCHRMGRRDRVRGGRRPSPTRSATATSRSSTASIYGTVRELGLALGDPHPGNYLLRPDGRVAFFDFGMLRRLPPGYLADEGEIAAAIREDDVALLLRRDARARLPARGAHRLGRRPAARVHARGLLVVEIRPGAAAGARGPVAQQRGDARDSAATSSSSCAG